MSNIGLLLKPYWGDLMVRVAPPPVSGSVPANQCRNIQGASLMGKGMALFATGVLERFHSSTLSLGPSLTGLIAAFPGITTVQCYKYFAFHSSRDKLPLKSFVALFFLLSILSAIFHLMSVCFSFCLKPGEGPCSMLSPLPSRNMYSIYITGFGDYLQASEVDWARRFDIFAVTFSA